MKVYNISVKFGGKVQNLSTWVLAEQYVWFHIEWLYDTRLSRRGGGGGGGLIHSEFDALNENKNITYTSQNLQLCSFAQRKSLCLKILWYLHSNVFISILLEINRNSYLRILGWYLKLKLIWKITPSVARQRFQKRTKLMLCLLPFPCLSATCLKHLNNLFIHPFA